MSSLTPFRWYCSERFRFQDICQALDFVCLICWIIINEGQALGMTESNTLGFASAQIASKGNISLVVDEDASCRARGGAVTAGCAHLVVDSQGTPLWLSKEGAGGAGVYACRLLALLAD
jgi:hypothetical protein